MEIKKIYKKDIPLVLKDKDFWNHKFLPVSKHRLYAHFKNEKCDDGDLVLLLAFVDTNLVGYMGVYTDRLILNEAEHKIGWLSTWWVDPLTKGSGVGRKILEAMYDHHNGKIGISQFTESAKRVYDKSQYFNTLKINKGLKAVLRSNITFVIPALYPKTAKFKRLFEATDGLLNIPINLKLKIQTPGLRKKLKDVTLEYVNIIDSDIEHLISKYGKKDISPKNADFFENLKAYNWVQEAPVLELTNVARYQFSMYDRQFNIYLIKILKGNNCIGFLVLQKRGFVSKVLFAYYDSKDAGIVSATIQLHCIKQDTREIICYDEDICGNFKKSTIFLYRTGKIKESIISKAFGEHNFDRYKMNFGDGDCSFA